MKISISETAFTEEVKELLTAQKTFLTPDEIERLVISGALKTYEIFCDDVSIGFFISKVDALYNGSLEFVITNTLPRVKGHTPLASLLGVVIPDFVKDKGFDSLRIHSERRGMDKILEDQGYEFQGSVFRKGIKSCVAA